MISHELKFIFIHIEKTAGTSIMWHLRDFSSDELIINRDKKDKLYMDVNLFNKFLLDKKKCKFTINNAKHLTIQEYIQFYGKELVDSYFKFSVVRNPYYRVLSWYFFMYPDVSKYPNVVIDKRVIKRVIREQLKPQTDFVNDDVYIVKYENLKSDLNSIEFFTNKGITFDNLPLINKNPELKYNPLELLDIELREFIYSYYEKDFIKFEYKK